MKLDDKQYQEKVNELVKLTLLRAELERNFGIPPRQKSDANSYMSVRGRIEVLASELS